MFCFALLMVKFGGKTYLKNNLKDTLILVGLLFTSILGAWTGSMKIMANTSLLGIEMLLILLLAKNLPLSIVKFKNFPISQILKFLSFLGATFVLFLSIFQTYQLSTWTWRPENKNGLPNSYTIKNPAMRGWSTNPKVGVGFDKVIDFINENVPPNDQILVLPDATIIYGLTGHRSYLYAPFIFHIDIFPKDQYRLRFIEYLKSHPPRWIIIHDQHEIPFVETTPLIKWLMLEDFLNEKYIKTWSEDHFSVLQFKPLSLENPTTY